MLRAINSKGRSGTAAWGATSAKLGPARRPRRLQQGRRSSSNQPLIGIAPMTRVVVPLPQPRPWMLGLTRNDRGVPLGNLRNVLFAAEWQGVLAYDAFAARVITQKPPPWGGTVAEWADEHDSRACEWLQE